MDNLESLLKELVCKTPADEIASDRRDTILDFLKMEIEYRRQHKIKRLLRLSGIKHVKTLDQFDWHFNLKVSKDDILAFVNSPWIENAFNLVLIGDTGLGKSHIAASICYEAVLRGYPTAFITAFDLVSRFIRPTTRLPKSIFMQRSEFSASMRSVISITKKRIPISSFRSSPKEMRSSPRSSLPISHPKSGARSSAPQPHLQSLIVSVSMEVITFEGRSYRLLKKHKTR